ncbi:MAG: TadE/TadG family type IV pilus assembly protein [Phenylobacterium sp.]|jgi:Flp pilus assembly protein TadG
MRLVRSLRDDRGVAAIEFALIIPVLVGVLLLGMDGWMRITQVSQMRSALQAGARYYEGGGSDDTNAANLAVKAWASVPADAQVIVARSCTCGAVVVACTSQCAPNNTLPQTFITLTANGTYHGVVHSESLTEVGSIRVR